MSMTKLEQLWGKVLSWLLWMFNKILILVFSCLNYNWQNWHFLFLKVIRNKKVGSHVISEYRLPNMFGSMLFWGYVKSEIRLCWLPSLEANASHHRRWSIIRQLRQGKSNTDIRTWTEKAGSTMLRESQYQNKLRPDGHYKKDKISYCHVIQLNCLLFCQQQTNQSLLPPSRHTDSNWVKLLFTTCKVQYTEYAQFTQPEGFLHALFTAGLIKKTNYVLILWSFCDWRPLRKYLQWGYKGYRNKTTDVLW